MTPLAEALIETTAQALAKVDHKLPTERVLRKYREDALVVLVAVLARLGGKKGEPGLFTFASTPAQMILSMADEIDGTLQDQVA
ncbi:hypothetical protein [Acidisoma sp. S159]|uniref:hypothetical protein n=1 Tax=Acidisoma sp. S159 TaxID=1747225 RepID=UPI00131C8B8B|nr:hypothetical protein [Acidisoma sp. S159]